MPPPEVLLLRHGLALDRDVAAAEGLADHRRPLTPEGVRRTALVVEALVRLELCCDLLLTSPLLRARQTARIARDGGLAPALDQESALEPGGDPLPRLGAWLGDGTPRRSGRIGLVGHEPDLSLLAARLCGMPPGSLRLKKAGAALMAVPATGHGCLTLLLTPRSLLGDR